MKGDGMTARAAAHAHQKISTGFIAIVFALSSVIAALTPFVLSKIASAEPYAYPSTNDQNRALNAPHVDFVSATTTDVTLTFINPKNYIACFEYRTDGDTSQAVATPNPNILVDDRYPHLCLTNETSTRTFSAQNYVEVRSTFGAERNHDFDWTKFDVLPPPDTSGVTFVNSPKYVRAGNGTDVAAQIVTLDSTTEARFFIDGDATPIAGYDIGGAGATTNWWRLATPLAAGAHTVTAEVMIDGVWYPVNGSGTVYALDLPWAEYLLPQAGATYRPNDKVVRVKADDEFNQFNRMVTVINGVSYTVQRSDCSDQGNFVLCDLENLGLPEGTYTAKTTTYTQANNRVDNLMSVPFTIDATAPAVFGLDIENDISGNVGAEIVAAASASDNTAVESVNFYVTTPRADGVCTGNGTKHAEFRQSTPSLDGKYRATLQVGSLHGTYCVSAMSRDVAKNNSSPVHQKLFIDNAAPVVAITSPTGNTTNATTVQIRGSVSDDNPSHYYLRIERPNGQVLFERTTNRTTSFTNELLHSWNTSSLPDGTYKIFLEARDALGNKDGTRTTPGSSVASTTLTIDRQAPVFSISTTNSGPYGPNNRYVTGTSTLAESVASHAFIVSQGSVSGTPTDWTWDTDGLASGTYSIKLSATDAAGNTGESNTIEITVDNDGPSLSIAPVLGTFTGGTVKPVVTANDPHGPITYKWELTDPSDDYEDIMSNDSVKEPTFSPTVAGTYSFTLTATDSLGNSSTEVFEFNWEPGQAPSFVDRSNAGAIVLAVTTPTQPEGLIATQFNTTNPQTLGITTESNADENNDGQVKDAATTKPGEKEVITQASSNNGWWLLLVVAVLVAAYYGYRNWRLSHAQQQS